VASGLGFLVHKRSEKTLLRRRIHRLIFNNSHRDCRRAEMVCMISRVEVAGLLHEPLEFHVIPDVENGEVLVDSRGQGSFQRVGRPRE
jgi:hypothetical protein